MNRHLVKTKDNSYTLFVPELDEHYHSIHGAMQEGEHVFIQAGLLKKAEVSKEISILEIGFGTGLNALLTCLTADAHGLTIDYNGLEKYPVEESEWTKLDYASALPENYTATTLNAQTVFNKLHTVDWEKGKKIQDNFSLRKRQLDFKALTDQNAFDVIYYDAFAPSAQADLWTIEIFERMFAALKPNGVLVTYCVKGTVRRNMIAAGFKVEKIPGPIGKREMARAYKF